MKVCVCLSHKSTFVNHDFENYNYKLMNIN